MVHTCMLETLWQKRCKQRVKTKTAEGERRKSRVSSGAAYEQWCQLKEQKQLQSDAMVALFVLDSNFLPG
uniref:Uncharacterized protein n=1 Tax=Sphaeramia orbicularis TaxID=375764 RepID=A0A673C2N1_9TELE